MKRFVLTGAPGSGKTSVIESLQQKGFTVFEEQARVHIQLALKHNTNIVPWGNHLAFSQNVAEAQLQQHHRQTSTLAFYDRGILDGLAYLRESKIEPPKDLLDKYQSIRYSPLVFFFSHWPEIHQNDETRREPEAQILSIQTAIKNTYKEFGYKIIEVPKTAVDLRVDFILKNIDE